MNLNDLAHEVSRREGKKKQVDIAQIKEVLAVLGDILFEQTLHDANLITGKLWLSGRARSLKKVKRQVKQTF